MQPPSSLPQVRQELIYQHGLLIINVKGRVFAVSNGGNPEDILLKTGNFMSTSRREVRYNVGFINPYMATPGCTQCDSVL